MSGVLRLAFTLMAKKEPPNQSPTIENRRARFDYEILETLEVGMVLRGTEVKSVRNGRVSLTEGYVRVQGEPPALFLHSVNIEPYAPGGPIGQPRQHNATRVRPLLAHTREIIKFAKLVQVKGMTCVPLRLYFKNGFAKLLIGVGRGRTKVDKRGVIAKRESGREIDRAMSRKVR
jgi:SsrA-binding protein